jgi:hypothetical protein
MTDKKDKGPEGDVPEVDAEALLADHRPPIDSGLVVQDGVCVDPSQFGTVRVIPGGEEGFDRFLDRAGDVHTGVRVQVQNIGPDDDDCCDDDDSGVDDDDSEWGSHDCQPLSAFNRVPVADINADGEPEIMLVGGDGQVHVLEGDTLRYVDSPQFELNLPPVERLYELEAGRAAAVVTTTMLDSGELGQLNRISWISPALPPAGKKIGMPGAYTYGQVDPKWKLGSFGEEPTKGDLDLGISIREQPHTASPDDDDSGSQE